MSDKTKRKRWDKQGEWDKNNMATLGCKVKKEQSVAFKVFAAKHGKTANTLLKDYVIACIKEDSDA